MNKISKKIVALATMAAFVLTLVPAAAFAADDSEFVSPGVDIQESGIHAIVNGKTVDSVDVSTNEDVTISFEINDENGVSASIHPDDTQDIPLTPAEYAEKVKIWAIDNDTKQITTALVMDPANKCALTQDNVYKLLAPVWDGNTLKVSFSKEGNYTIYAGVGDFTADGSIENIALLSASSVTVDVDDNTIVDEIAFNSTPAITWDTNDSTVGELNLIGYTGFDADGIKVYDFEATTKADGKIAPYETITVESGDDHLKIMNADADSETEGIQIVTDNKGKATISFRMNDNRNVPITISAGEVEYLIKVIKEEATPYDIDTTEDEGYVLAGNDSKWAYNGQDVFTNAVQFSVKDITGDAITGDLNGIEPAATLDANGFGTGEKISVEGKPTKSDLNAKDLILYWDADNSVYTLKYVGNAIADDLIPGEYKVRVGLNSGDYTDAVFNVAKFGAVVDTVVDMTAVDRTTQAPVGDVRNVKIDDEVTLGQDVYAVAYFVDENGLKVPAKNVTIGAYGNALIDNKTNVNTSLNTLAFQTKADIESNESLIGTTITVTATSQNYEQYKTVELTVVDSYNAFSLEFDPLEGPINEDSDVTVSVVKEDGSAAQVSGKIIAAYVEDQSNKDAKVTIDGVGNKVTNGKGKITVYASEPTTVDIVVVVEDATNNGLYGATLEYNAGNVDITAHHEVTMVIGSSKYVVDKQMFEMDAAPYVDSNWRTMVPIRALAEAFDAEVIYDNDDRTVTINYDEKTIVMTIDESTYTVDGEEMTMDTAAVIKGDRTYVPVRFAAEAMGFTVNALYNEGNSTASVVFQS